MRPYLLVFHKLTTLKILLKTAVDVANTVVRVLAIQTFDDQLQKQSPEGVL